MFRLLFLVVLCISGQMYVGQNMPKPVARFSFNNGSDFDEISLKKIKAVNVSHCRDRFGNKNNAYYFYGNASSYINLGNYAAIKPSSGSISLWVCIESEIWSGKGRYMSPFIITKNSTRDDFYEAYCIVYFPETDKVTALLTQDSIRQLSTTSVEKFELQKWQHVAITYDNHYLSFYINGVLEKKLPKNFETRFLSTDSVVLGHTANKKNERFLDGRIDDVEFYDTVLSPDEIRDLYEAPDPNRNRIILHWILAGAGFIAFTGLVFLFIRYRIRLAIKKEKQRMELINKSLETELRIQRALMSPHFIFNSLNGLQNFILTNANEDANDYLVKFSQLMRKILESNMSDTITLALEVDVLKRYLEIEEMRFEENISWQIHIDPLINPAAVTIPIMMLQPFIENAIWHGLLSKEGDKAIVISFSLFEKKYISCVIEDNGVGRKNAESHKTEKKSLATLFVRQRLELLNKIHRLDCSLEIHDKEEGQGTIVTIILPILNGY